MTPCTENLPCTFPSPCPTLLQLALCPRRLTCGRASIDCTALWRPVCSANRRWGAGSSVVARYPFTQLPLSVVAESFHQRSPLHTALSRVSHTHLLLAFSVLGVVTALLYHPQVSKPPAWFSYTLFIPYK